MTRDTWLRTVPYPQAVDASIEFEDIFQGLRTNDRTVTVVGADANRLIELRHKYGHSVWASMSKSATVTSCGRCR